MHRGKDTHMHAANGTVPWGVIERLYRPHKWLSQIPGRSLDADVAEHPISLALSSRRSCTSAPLFLCDVRRNVRRSTLRSQCRQAKLQEKYETLAACGAEIVDPDTAESLCVASEFHEQLRTAAVRVGPVAVCYLEGLLIGESVDETATARTASLRTIDRMRRFIRSRALSLVREAVG